jgi:hypothetical protein
VAVCLLLAFVHDQRSVYTHSPRLDRCIRCGESGGTLIEIEVFVLTTALKDHLALSPTPCKGTLLTRVLYTEKGRTMAMELRRGFVMYNSAVKDKKGDVPIPHNIARMLTCFLCMGAGRSWSLPVIDGDAYIAISFSRRGQASIAMTRKAAVRPETLTIVAPEKTTLGYLGDVCKDNSPVWRGQVAERTKQAT